MGSTKKPAIVRGRQEVVVNQKAPVFKDRRTKRERDRSSVNRKAVERSREEQ